MTKLKYKDSNGDEQELTFEVDNQLIRSNINPSVEWKQTILIAKDKFGNKAFVKVLDSQEIGLSNGHD